MRAPSNGLIVANLQAADNFRPLQLISDVVICFGHLVKFIVQAQVLFLDDVAVLLQLLDVKSEIRLILVQLIFGLLALAEVCVEVSHLASELVLNSFQVFDLPEEVLIVC